MVSLHVDSLFKIKILRRIIMLEGLMRALKILKEEHLSNYEEELLMEDLVEKLEGEILNIIEERISRCIDYFNEF